MSILVLRENRKDISCTAFDYIDIGTLSTYPPQKTATLSIESPKVLLTLYLIINESLLFCH